MVGVRVNTKRRYKEHSDQVKVVQRVRAFYPGVIIYEKIESAYQ